MTVIQTKETDYEVIPANTYAATFKGIEQKSNANGDYLLWRFEVTGKSGKTAEVVGSSGLTFGPKAKAFGWAGVLRGREYTPGEPIEVNELIGKPCRLIVTVEPRNDGQGTRNTIAAMLPAEGKAGDDSLF